MQYCFKIALYRGTQRFVSGNNCSEDPKSPEIFGFSCSES